MTVEYEVESFFVMFMLFLFGLDKDHLILAHLYHNNKAETDPNPSTSTTSHFISASKSPDSGHRIQPTP